jgi:DUF4097 and DUF4098 domain-containing protein YvlB
MQHQFRGTVPQHLYVELQVGDVTVTATDTDLVTVEIADSDAGLVTVEQQGDRVSVVGQRRGGFFVSNRGVGVTVTAPAGSDLVTKLGSATVRTHGPLSELRVSTGSGEVTLDEVTGNAVVKTGSGSIHARRLGGAARLKAGSGTIRVGHLGADGQLTTGSGDIEVERAATSASLKSGSGDLTVHTADADVSLSTASGDLRVGRMSRGQALMKNVSGDIRLGIPAGTPVWTDLSTGTGRLTSDLRPTGAPGPGQDHVEVRAKTLTGDIHLEQLVEEQS